MEHKRYEHATDKTIIELKKYLIANLSAKQATSYAKLINKSYSNGDLKSNINGNKEVQLAIFSMIKCRVNAAANLRELEEELIYLNLLINHNFKPGLEYKYHLFNSLVKTGQTDERMVMVIRHLIRYRVEIIGELIDYLGEQAKLEERTQEAIKIKVFVIEGELNRAVQACSLNRIDGLGKYSHVLNEMVPWKYHRKLNRSRIMGKNMLKLSR